MTDAANPPKAMAGRGWLRLAAILAGIFVLGAGAGLSAAVFMGGDREAAGAAAATEPSQADAGDMRTELPVGRIAVVLPSEAAGGKIHLLITPLVVGQAPASEDAPAHEAGAGEVPVGPVPELRDAFIEYLSQLHEADIRGSLGLMTLRAELLRRAQAVAPELNASAVLIQEFLIQ